LSTEGQIVQANPAASQLFRYDAEELAGGELTGADHRGRLLRVSAAIHAHGTTTRREDRVSPRTVTAITSRSAAPASASRTRSSAGDRRRHHRAVKLAQMALRAAHDELEGGSATAPRARGVNAQLTGQREAGTARDHAIDASKAKSAFLANMSHELRTPLNAIIGYSELIEEESHEAATMNLSDLGKIRAAALHLLALIDDILDVSKIEAGKMELYVESFDAKELLDDVVATIQPLAARNHNELKIELPPGLGGLHTDRTKLKQVALNLLSNACKFTHEGEVRLAVRRVCGRRRRVAAPRGPGLRHRHRVRAAGGAVPAVSSGRRVDHPQVRRHRPGLSISRHYCQMMHGSIQARSALGAARPSRCGSPSTCACIPSQRRGVL
jgi:signal transduction histidine kinase